MHCGSRKPRYLRCFLPLVAKITVFTVFFALGRAKTVVFTQFLRCCKIYFLYTKTINTLYFTRFLLPMRSQKSSKNSSKPVQNRLPEASYNFSLVFPGPRSSFSAREPQQCENTSRVKDFWRWASRRSGGSAAGARPRVAKASCRLPSHTASIAGFYCIRSMLPL